MVLAAALFITWLPWPIRNYTKLHTVRAAAHDGGVALWDSHSENAPIVAWTYMADHPELGEVGFDRHFSSATVQLIRDDPPGFVRRVARATLEYMGPIRDRRLNTWLHRFALLACWPRCGGPRRVPGSSSRRWSGSRSARSSSRSRSTTAIASPRSGAS
jgi:hypothetical protein